MRRRRRFHRVIPRASGTVCPGQRAAVGRSGGSLTNTELDAALSDCNRSIQLSPFNDIGYEDRAIVWLRRGEAERAFQDAAFALNQSSTNPRALYLRGLALMALGHTEEGRTDIADAKKANARAVQFLAGWGLKP